MHVPLWTCHRMPGLGAELERPPGDTILPRTRGNRHVSRELLSHRHVVQAVGGTEAVLFLLR